MRFVFRIFLSLKFKRHCCWGTSEISVRCHNSNCESCSFKTSWGLTIRRLSRYWNSSNRIIGHDCYWGWLITECRNGSRSSVVCTASCIITAIWHSHKTLSQWECSVHRNLHCHWLKGLRLSDCCSNTETWPAGALPQIQTWLCLFPVFRAGSRIHSWLWEIALTHIEVRTNG